MRAANASLTCQLSRENTAPAALCKPKTFFRQKAANSPLCDASVIVKIYIIAMHCDIFHTTSRLRYFSVIFRPAIKRRVHHLNRLAATTLDVCVRGNAALLHKSSFVLGGLASGNFVGTGGGVLHGAIEQPCRQRCSHSRLVILRANERNKRGSTF
jgi:hypothetical protein